MKEVIVIEGDVTIPPKDDDSKVGIMNNAINYLQEEEKKRGLEFVPS